MTALVAGGQTVCEQVSPGLLPQSGLLLTTRSITVCGRETCWLCGTREWNNERLLQDNASAAVLRMPGICSAVIWKL